MPIYDYSCPLCGNTETKVQSIGDLPPECCGYPMSKVPTFPAMIRIKGQGYPSRRKWMNEWTPDSKPMQIGSIHGQKY